jgi:hypothetical protein
MGHGMLSPGEPSQTTNRDNIGRKQIIAMETGPWPEQVADVEKISIDTLSPVLHAKRNE